jgi:glycerol uptake facilitator-like aquaporin
VALILTFGPISGAHVNPAVSFADASQGGLSWGDASMYAIAQFVGALVGVAIADAMFAEPIYAWSHHARAGFPQALSEGIATFGLLSVILGVRPTSARGRALRGRRVHYRRVLVHGVHLICESCGDDRSCRDPHVRWDTAE